MSGEIRGQVTAAMAGLIIGGIPARLRGNPREILE